MASEDQWTKGLAGLDLMRWWEGDLLAVDWLLLSEGSNEKQGLALLFTQGLRLNLEGGRSLPGLPFVAQSGVKAFHAWLVDSLLLLGCSGGVS